MFTCLLLIGLANAFVPSQDPIELRRLANDQQRLADQAQRLQNLLGSLEERERQEGNQALAVLLQKAKKRLHEADGALGLVAALEGAANDLGSLRSGPALTIQAEVIELLEETLDLLLETQQSNQLDALQKAADNRVQTLEEWAKEQEKLLKDTQELDQEEKRAGILEQVRRQELAEEQENLNQKIRDTAQNPEKGINADEILQFSEEAESQLSTTEGDLEKSTDAQKKALEEIQKEAQQSKTEQQKLESAREIQHLLQFLAEAEEILARHRAVNTELEILVTKQKPQPRSARLRIRKLAEEEMDLSRTTGTLSLELREERAGTFSFLVGTLEDDHRVLGRRLGPPNFQINETQIILSRRITTNWTALIDAVRLEADRERQRLEESSLPGNPSQTPPLVSFAAEIHLLATLEKDVHGALDALVRRRKILADSNLPWDEDDTIELDMLIERQQRLRRLFDAMLESLQTQEEPPEEDL